jgi:leucyl aminopeptidase (aminopeptidase T)
VDRARVLEHPAWCANLIEAAGLRSGERVLVAVDEPLAVEGSELAAAVKDAGGEPRLALWTGERPLRHVPGDTIEIAAHADVGFVLQAQPLAEEASVRAMLYNAVREHDGRVLYLGFVDGELLRGELSRPAPKLAESARRVLAQLEGVDRIRITGRAGTDLELRVAGRPWDTDAGPLRPGGMANFPGGEIFVAPPTDGADGVLVADLTVPYTVNGLVDAPVTLRFERGRVTAIEGGVAAQALRELVADAGAGADVVAELGIGLNPAVAPRGHVMLDEKAAGTAHVAIGNNVGFPGGENAAAIHVDCVFSHPQVEADGRRVELP